MVKKKQIEEEITANDVIQEVVKVNSIESQIQSLAVKNEIPVEKLVAEYQKQYEELSVKGVSANLEKLAYNGVLNLVRKKTKPKVDYVPKAKAEQVVGFVIADSGVFDKVAMMANQARSYVSKFGIAAAVSKGFINKDSEPLDTRAETFGKPNKDYRQPLGKRDKEGNFVYSKERSRTLDLIAKVRDNDWAIGTIQTNDNQLAVAWGKVRFFTLASIFGIVKEVTPKPLTDEQKEAMSEEEQTAYYAQPHSFILNSSMAEDTKSIFHAVHDNVNVDEVFFKVVGPRLTKIIDLEREFDLLPKNAKGKAPWNNRFYVRGTVTSIARDRPSPIGTIYMGLWDPETGAEVGVQIPEHLTADFGENSEIIVIGKLERGDLRVEAEDGGRATYEKGQGSVRLNALGFYKIPDMCTPAESSTSAALDDENAINGWED